MASEVFIRLSPSKAMMKQLGKSVASFFFSLMMSL